MDALTEALLAGVDAERIGEIDLPDDYLAAHLRVDDLNMFDGLPERDVRKSLHVDRVPLPELAPDEVLIAVMASSINYNTVWSATFQPVSTFGFLRRLGREGGWATRHDLPHHVVGSDASGVVVRAGAGVRWRNRPPRASTWAAKDASNWVLPQPTGPRTTATALCPFSLLSSIPPKLPSSPE
ncbi:hypothetical protein [Streptomyces sp. NPDC088755]|uniref:hypothetical protein n=1 Tax=Streptomyces sp. NPDC088755 TaxID=3365888 RepID=UPI0038228544